MGHSRLRIQVLVGWRWRKIVFWGQRTEFWVVKFANRKYLGSCVYRLTIPLPVVKNTFCQRFSTQNWILILFWPILFNSKLNFDSILTHSFQLKIEFWFYFDPFFSTQNWMLILFWPILFNSKLNSDSTLTHSGDIWEFSKRFFQPISFDLYWNIK